MLISFSLYPLPLSSFSKFSDKFKNLDVAGIELFNQVFVGEKQSGASEAIMLGVGCRFASELMEPQALFEVLEH